MEIGLLAAACGAELQNLFQGEVGPSLAQSVGLKGAGRVGECQLAFVVLSSEGVTNTGLLVTRLAWMAFGEISSQLFKYIYPKVSLQSQPQRVSWEHWPAKISAVVPVGEGWGRRSSQLPRNIHPLHGIQHLCFYFFSLPTYLCLPDLQG